MKAAPLFICLLLFAATLSAADHLPVEDHIFFAESAWNRQNAAFQLNSFQLGDASAHELAHEWAISPRNQVSLLLPLFDGETTGLGDATLSLRHQFAGDPDSRFAAAVRASLVLPTRSQAYGEKFTGAQLNVPVSFAITSRLTSNTNLGGTWFGDDRAELELVQSLAFVVRERLTVSIEATWKEATGGEPIRLVRPGLQYAFDTGSGLQISPGVAVPLNGDGVLFFVAFEQALPERR